MPTPLIITGLSASTILASTFEFRPYRQTTCFFEKVEAVFKTRIVDKCLLRETFPVFYRKTHETVLLLVYLFFITVSNLPCLLRDIKKIAV